MNALMLSWKNQINKPLSMLLSLILFALGVGLISILLLLNQQLNEKFTKNLADINLVIGAKGSPVQLILCNMYHIDSPTGNISIKEARPFMNPEHPLIQLAVPISLGDSYKGYRLVGTTHEYVDSVYRGKVEKGKLWEAELEVTVGASVARNLQLQLGDRFYSSHGLLDDGVNVHEHGDGFKVVGILEPSGAVLDQLILTSPQSVWAVHDHGSTSEGDHDDHDHGSASEGDHDDHDHGTASEGDHDDHDHGTASEGDHDDHDHGSTSEGDHDDHDHGSTSEGDHDDHDHGSASESDHGDHDHGSASEGDHDHHDHDGHDHAAHTVAKAAKIPTKPLMDEVDKDITALLIRYRNRSNWRALNLPRNINENTDMQAANPAFEIARLRDQLGVGGQALGQLALLIIVVSGLSIFIALYNSLKERKYELALMRVMGASQSKLFVMVILEGLILAFCGYVFGVLLSHLGMEILASYMQDSYRYSFTGRTFLIEELYLLGGALGIGLVAAILPAWQAYRTDIANTLTDF
ncbi:MAG: FtsX-like permease family protein [Bacteroidota bacterium]